jgi:hypothetical protein
MEQIFPICEKVASKAYKNKYTSIPCYFIPVNTAINSTTKDLYSVIAATTIYTITSLFPSKCLF